MNYVHGNQENWTTTFKLEGGVRGHFFTVSTNNEDLLAGNDMEGDDKSGQRAGSLLALQQSPN